MMMFQVRTPTPLMKVSNRDCHTLGPLCGASGAWYFSCILPDMIYEDVQRDSRPLDADNGWSSSEFESYDEQSDAEPKLPTRSKVPLVCVHDRRVFFFLSFCLSIFLSVERDCLAVSQTSITIYSSR